MKQVLTILLSNLANSFLNKSITPWEWETKPISGSFTDEHLARGFTGTIYIHL